MASNWKTVQINSTSYIFKVKQIGANNQSTCLLSDFKTIWSETIDASKLLDRARDNNPYLDIDESVLKTISCLPDESNTNPLNIELAQCDGALQLKLKYSSVGKLVFFWNLKKRDVNEFYEEVTKPLLGHVTELRNEATMLRAVITQKDEEIIQYKAELRRNEIRRFPSTKPFDQSQILSTELFDCSLLPFAECWKDDKDVKVEIVQNAGSTTEDIHSTESAIATVKQKTPIKQNLMPKLETVAMQKISYEETDSQEIEENISPIDETQAQHSNEVNCNEKRRNPVSDQPQKRQKPLNL